METAIRLTIFKSMANQKGVAAIVDGRYDVTAFIRDGNSRGEIHGLSESFLDHKLDGRILTHLRTVDGSFDHTVAIRKAEESGKIWVAYFETRWFSTYD